MNIISVAVGLLALLMFGLSLFFPSLAWLGSLSVLVAIFGLFIGAMSRYYKVGAILNFVLVLIIALWLLYHDKLLKISIFM